MRRVVDLLIVLLLNLVSPTPPIFFKPQKRNSTFIIDDPNNWTQHETPKITF